MRALHQTLILLTLLACSGCGRADMIDARRDHILAGDHGWIDVTLHAPAAAGSQPAASAVAQPLSCLATFQINGETQFSEPGDLARADAAHNPLGYRFVAPAGALQTALTISGCVKTDTVVALPVTLEKDHLATLEFDGQHLVLRSSSSYEPASLDGVRGEMTKLRDGARAADGTLSTLTWLVIASVLLNAVVIVVALRRKSR